MHVFKVPSRLRADSGGYIPEGTNENIKSSDDNNVGSEPSDSSAAAVFNMNTGTGF